MHVWLQKGCRNTHHPHLPCDSPELQGSALSFEVSGDCQSNITCSATSEACPQCCHLQATLSTVLCRINLLPETSSMKVPVEMLRSALLSASKTSHFFSFPVCHMCHTLNGIYGRAASFYQNNRKPMNLYFAASSCVRG